MKTIEKTKKFVKKNWKPLLIGAGVTCGVGVAYVLGFKRGSDMGVDVTLNELSKKLGIDMTKDYAYNHTICEGITLADIGIDNEVLEFLKPCGFESLDEKPLATLIIQKGEA